MTLRLARRCSIEKLRGCHTGFLEELCGKAPPFGRDLKLRLATLPQLSLALQISQRANWAAARGGFWRLLVALSRAFLSGLTLVVFPMTVAESVDLRR